MREPAGERYRVRGGRLCATPERSWGAAWWQVTPYRPLPLDGANPASRIPLPPLVRGYLRMGAAVCGPPAWDQAFRTADVVMVLPMQRLARRFADRFDRAA
jgi:putative hemolysin